MSDDQQERGASSGERRVTALPTRDARRSTLAPTRWMQVVMLATLPLLGACNWFTDFKNQPRIETWEAASQRDNDTTHAPRGQPAMAVPVTGTAVAAYQISYTPVPAVLDSIAAATNNPTAPSAASLVNGRKYYSINCAVCHGDTGVGNGPATKYGVPGISIISDMTQGRLDGYIYGMIRNGRGAMPNYNRIEELDRWDVVNYVRALQGRIPNTAGIGPTGYPGQNGTTVPGYTVMAPTRPAPMWRGTAGQASVTPVPAGELTTPAPAAGADTAARSAAPAAAPSAGSVPPQTKGGTQ